MLGNDNYSQSVYMRGVVANHLRGQRSSFQQVYPNDAHQGMTRSRRESERV